MHNGKNLKDKHMNKSIDALKPVLTLALEALEHEAEIGNDDAYRPERDALREALAHAPTEREQPAQQDSTCSIRLCAQGKPYPRTCKKCGLGPCSSKQEQPAQEPEVREQQEPVAWATRMGEYAHIHWGAKRPEYPMVYEVPLYTSPPAAPASQEEIQRLSALVRAQQITIEKLESQRQWVGLTQQDIDIAFDDTQEGGGFNEFARAIEAKLRELNEHREKNA